MNDTLITLGRAGAIVIDLTQVAIVGKVSGDQAWRRYTISLRGGLSVEVYEEDRTHGDPFYPRDEFIRRWAKAIGGSNE